MHNNSFLGWYNYVRTQHQGSSTQSSFRLYLDFLGSPRNTRFDAGENPDRPSATSNIVIPGLRRRQRSWRRWHELRRWSHSLAFNMILDGAKCHETPSSEHSIFLQVEPYRCHSVMMKRVRLVESETHKLETMPLKRWRWLAFPAFTQHIRAWPWLMFR